MKVIILAAGQGSRLGETQPKPLTHLYYGQSILQRQIEAITNHVYLDDIIVVVGFKKEMIMETLPDLSYVYNARFHVTNTAKSLLLALRKVRGHDVIWLNGDVVLDSEVVSKIVKCDNSCMGVNKGAVGEEEVKYRLNEKGSISHVSKEVESPLGEALGINKVLSESVEILMTNLEACSDSDYFERGIEMAIEEGLDIYPVDLTHTLCMEVDDFEDLARANDLVSKETMRGESPADIS